MIPDSKTREILAKFAWLADRMAEHNYEHYIMLGQLQTDGIEGLVTADRIRTWNTQTKLYYKMQACNAIYDSMIQKGMQDRWKVDMS